MTLLLPACDLLKWFQAASFVWLWCSGAMAGKALVARHISAFSVALFLSCKLDLDEVKKTAVALMPMLLQCVKTLQETTWSLERAHVLSRCHALIHVGQKAFAKVDGSGNFETPDPLPQPESFFIQPCEPKPLLAMLDEWTPRREAVEMSRFGYASELLSQIREHVPEPELRISACVQHVLSVRCHCILDHEVLRRAVGHPASYHVRLHDHPLPTLQDAGSVETWRKVVASLAPQQPTCCFSPCSQGRGFQRRS